MPAVAGRALRGCREVRGSRRGIDVGPRGIRVCSAAVLAGCLLSPCATAEGLALGSFDVGGAVRVNLTIGAYF